jgi:hypothetical protein
VGKKWPAKSGDLEMAFRSSQLRSKGSSNTSDRETVTGVLRSRWEPGKFSPLDCGLDVEYESDSCLTLTSGAEEWRESGVSRDIIRDNILLQIGYDGRL